MDSKQQAMIDKIDARIQQTESELKKLRAQAREAEAQKKLDLENQIDKLKRHKDAASEQLNELKQSGGRAWDDIKAGAERAWDSLGKAMDDAQQRFS